MPEVTLLPPSVSKSVTTTDARRTHILRQLPFRLLCPHPSPLLPCVPEEIRFTALKWYSFPACKRPCTLRILNRRPGVFRIRGEICWIPLARASPFRLLRSPLGEHLRAIATLGDQSNRTARAVALLNDDFAKLLGGEEFASPARMSASTLHDHFHVLTHVSPLKCRRRMRPRAACVRMVTEGIDAASAAYQVGQESASQVNREYRRLFGQPLMRDIKARQISGVKEAVV